MINFSDITKAAQEMVVADSDFSGFVVTRGEFINEDQGMDKWIGIYKVGTDYNTRTLGGVRPWLTNVKLLVIAQAFGVEGEEVEDLLDARVENLLDLFESDRTIKGTVDIINNYNIVYSYDRDDHTSFIFQNAMIEINAEARA